MSTWISISTGIMDIIHRFIKINILTWSWVIERNDLKKDILITILPTKINLAATEKRINTFQELLLMKTLNHNGL